MGRLPCQMDGRLASFHGLLFLVDTKELVIVGIGLGAPTSYVHEALHLIEFGQEIVQ